MLARCSQWSDAVEADGSEDVEVSELLRPSPGFAAMMVV